MKTLILMLAAIVASAQTPKGKVEHGPRGGCYVVVTSKSGKQYKRYQPCPKEGK